MRDYSLGVELHHSEPPGAPRELQDLGRAFSGLAMRMSFAFEHANLLLDEQERLSGELGCTPNDAPPLKVGCNDRLVDSAGLRES